MYRRYLDFNAFEALRNMKAMIDQETSRKGLNNNIKLGPGGIREIEFVCQVFQLIRGGRQLALQQRHGIPGTTGTAGNSGLALPEAVPIRQAQPRRSVSIWV